jgi:hypothetical protein
MAVRAAALPISKNARRRNGALTVVRRLLSDPRHTSQPSTIFLQARRATRFADKSIGPAGAELPVFTPS